MDRQTMIESLEQQSGPWDILVIGGGATGLGTAVEAASRGYQTILLEQHDFAKGTSSRSTKLIHGGVRYLQQGNILLVLEALHERGLLFQNAPHLVRNQSFVVPNYEWWDGPFYGVGMKVYDLLAGKLGLGPSKWLSKEETLNRIPTIETERLKGGVVYYDGQFDDARLAINLAQTAVDHGGVTINYMKVTELLKTHGMVSGVTAVDMETGDKFQLQSKVVINATGVFTDSVLKLDDPNSEEIIIPSQGIHLVLDREFLPGESAIMVPHTEDGRVLFAVPWHDKVVVGTTDTPVEEVVLEPRAMAEEVEFVLNHAVQYLSKDPIPRDVLSVFAGLRPLVSPEDTDETATISRDHYIVVSPSGLVTITGGKWTTYRKMGEDAINQAVLVGDLDERPSLSKDLRIHGWAKDAKRNDPLHLYGADSIVIKNLIKDQPRLSERVHPQLPYKKAEIVWAVQKEMARTVEDVLARRTRALFLNAKVSIEIAPQVAKLIAEQMGYDKNWQETQVSEFTKLAEGYLLED